MTVLNRPEVILHLLLLDDDGQLVRVLGSRLRPADPRDKPPSDLLVEPIRCVVRDSLKEANIVKPARGRHINIRVIERLALVISQERVPKTVELDLLEEGLYVLEAQVHPNDAGEVAIAVVHGERAGNNERAAGYSIIWLGP